MIEATKSALASGGIGSMYSAVDSAVGGAMNLAGAKLNYKYQKRLMRLQNAYDVQQWNRENERQNFLLNNQVQFTKNSLRNAGYSVANPEGMTTQATTAPSGSTPDIPGNITSGWGNGSHPDLGALSSIQLQQSQAHMAEAEARLKEAEARQKEKYADLYEIYGEQEWNAAIGKLNAEQRRAIEEALKVDQDRLNSIVLTDAQEEQIRTMTKIEYDKLEPTLKLLAAELVVAQTQGKLNQAKTAESYQAIKESQQKIENLKKDYEFTDAQIAVANQEVKRLGAEARKKRFESEKERTEWMQKEFDRIAHEKLGLTFRMAREVFDALNPLSAIGAALNR